MKTREEIIKSLETCFDFDIGCEECMYNNECNGCTNLKRDAVALLKELMSQLEQPTSAPSKPPQKRSWE